MKKSNQKKQRVKARKRKAASGKQRSASVITCCLLLITGILCAIIAGAHESTKKPVLFETSEKTVKGIDVSSHNGEIDWNTVAQNTDFVIIRVGYRGYGTGKITQDANFEQNIKGATDAGIRTGVYFYSQATTEQEAREEAEFTLKAIANYNISLPVFIDFEYAHGSNGELTGRLYDANLSSAEAAKIINAFCGRVSRRGKFSGVYANSSVLNKSIKTSALNKDAYIWVADYNKAVTYLGSYDLWQHTKKGSCNGISSKYVDENIWFVKN